MVPSPLVSSSSESQTPGIRPGDGDGRPVWIGPMAGMLYPAGGVVGILVVAGFGLEALSLVQSLALFGGMAARAGYPTLVYDHVGTGNSGDAESLSLADWIAGVAEAAGALCRMTGVRHVILMGHGLGSLIALKAASQVDSLAGIVAMAPVTSGRAYVREAAALASLSDGQAGSGGFDLPAGFADELKKLVIPADDIAPFYVVAERANRAGDREVRERLEAKGAATIVVDYHDYAVSDPTSTIAPTASFRAILDALRLAAPPKASTAMADSTEPVTSYSTRDFEERGLAVGGGVFGIYCRPARVNAERPAVVLIGSGRDPSVGWGRFGVEQARALARQGIASLRFDLTGVGQSRSGPDGEELLYSDQHIADVASAAAALTRQGHEKIVLSGRCSGGYLGLHAAAKVPNLAGVVAINLLRLIWDPAEKVEDAIVGDIRPLSALTARALDRGVIKRVLTGQINPLRAMRRLARAVMNRLPPLPLSPAGQRRRQALALIDAIGKRGGRVLFASAEDDPSIDLLHSIFGKPAKAMRRRKFVSFEGIAEADHNLTPPGARRQMIDKLAAFVSR